MIKFDAALPAALNELKRQFADNSYPSTHIVRDIGGQLVIVLPDSALPSDGWNSFAQELDAALGAYSPGSARVLLRESDLIDPDDILNSPDRIRLEQSNTWLIDRLLTNQDWIRPTLKKVTTCPTGVAYSVKGGVGRSTALAMFAWYLARNGKNVLIADMDLEAPGIASILLSELPDTGLVDWLMESINGQATEELLISAMAEAPIASDTDGRIRVLAAYGKDSHNYISKLGRVYGTSTSADGSIIGLAERLETLVEMISALNDAPDVLLIDSRAGLHDIGSAVVTRLGAEVFMFARNDDQDWWSYHQLFEHLKYSQSVSQGMGSDDDLRWKLKMVAAQTNPTDSARRDWLARSYTEWTSFYDDESVIADGNFMPHAFARDDDEAPHSPLFINFDTGVRSARLNSVEERPNWEFIQGLFGEFFAGAEQRLWPEVNEGDS